VKITQDLIEDIRDEIRDRVEDSGKYLPLVVFGLVSEGFSLTEISEIKIGNIDTNIRVIIKNDYPCVLSNETNNDIIKYIESTTEVKIIRMLLNNSSGLRLYEIGRYFGLDDPGGWSGLKYNYLNRLIDDGAIGEVTTGKIKRYITTEGMANDFINHLYLTRFRSDQKSSGESLRGHFKKALEISDMDPSLTPKYFKKNCLPMIS